MTSVACENLCTVHYQHNTDLSSYDDMGMRPMQQRAFAKRNSRFLLIKAPPACGKSRALMFLALDKVIKQGLNKVIVAVPQMAIGSSFKNTNLTSQGFFANWAVEDKYNLCTPGSDSSKAQTVMEFLEDGGAHYLVCPHATLVNFYQKLDDKHKLDEALVAIDEFHHVSADAESRLGDVVHSLMTETSAHIVAMTGSYFRGDGVPVLDPKDEEKFDEVTYTYYEQLSSYKYLKTLFIDYAFYDGKWTDAVMQVLDKHKKTIIHIPSVNARESTKDKINEVGIILDGLGKNLGQDQTTGIIKVKTDDGTVLKIADLVSDLDPKLRIAALNYLRSHDEKDAVDIIIALGMAKEGFDWPWCEHALTIGYRNSLTEVVQIIGRATRDAEGKTEAKFTNLIAKPDALEGDIGDAVNTLLKAITLSLLMEQVLAPNVHFRVRSDDQGGGQGEKPTHQGITIVINDDKDHPLSKDAKDILDNGGQRVIEELLNNDKAMRRSVLKKGEASAKLLLEEELPKIIDDLKPNANFSQEEIETLCKAILTAISIKTPGDHDHGQGNGPGSEDNEDDQKENKETELPHSHEDGNENKGGQILNLDKKFINLDDLDIDLLLKVNPFAKIHDFIARNIDPDTLKIIQDTVINSRSHVTEQEAAILWPHIKKFKIEHGRAPSPNSSDDYEKRLGDVLAYVRYQKAKKLGEKAQ